MSMWDLSMMDFRQPHQSDMSDPELVSLVHVPACPQNYRDKWKVHLLLSVTAVVLYIIQIEMFTPAMNNKYSASLQSCHDHGDITRANDNNWQRYYDFPFFHVMVCGVNELGLSIVLIVICLFALQFATCIMCSECK